MNDDELEEQGFLKKILAAKKGTGKADPPLKPDAETKTNDVTDIDALMKRIGVQNVITPPSVPSPPAPSGQVGAGKEIPDATRISCTSILPSQTTPLVRFPAHYAVSSRRTTYYAPRKQWTCPGDTSCCSQARDSGYPGTGCERCKDDVV